MEEVNISTPQRNKSDEVCRRMESYKDGDRAQGCYPLTCSQSQHKERKKLRGTLKQGQLDHLIMAVLTTSVAFLLHLASSAA
ncbi:hypothetical protein XENORESO_018447, partial [Xenotaenia resolanae]